MRDPRRIRKFCNALADFWETYVPDFRFWQVLNLIAGGLQRDPFFLEESEWLKMLQDYKAKMETNNG